jgi:predicted phage terminase large subunit-like protein
LVVINFIAKGLALNPWSRFLHLSYSDDLALLNSSTAREIVRSDEFQELWSLKIADDSKSKKRWNVVVDGKIAGGVYATSLSGQITGFRAGHMVEGFSGAILLDDLLKPEDAFSKTKLNAANRKLLTTIKSRKANPDTPIILIMQRISENDPVDFILNGNVPGEWASIAIPALIDREYVNKKIDPKYHAEIDIPEDQERFSYWPYKESFEELLEMERGEGTDQAGGRISRHVFASQYQQNPVAIGGNIIRGEYFERYTILPRLTQRNIYVDTAQKTAERNDFSVFQCWGKGSNHKIYLLDQIRGKWEGPELKKRAIDFWRKHIAFNVEEEMGQLRKMKVEDKSSGTDLIQSIRLLNQIPIEAVQRSKDKLTRVMDATPYIEQRLLCVPAEASFTNDFISECEAFTGDDSHAHDDQVDPMVDAVSDLLSNANKMKIWENVVSSVQR